MAALPHVARMVAGALVAACALGGGNAHAQRPGMGAPAQGGGGLSGDAPPEEMQGLEIIEKPGAVIPQDLVFQDHAGRDVKLASFFDGTRPTVLVMAYYECPMLCTLVLNGMKDGMKDLAWTAGREYRVVTVSIDPRDTVKSAEEKRAIYVKAYGRDVGTDGWDFLVGSPENVKKLADTVGFNYRWIESRKEYGHAAGAFVLTPGGVVSRTLYGIAFAGRDLRLALAEASQGLLGSAWDKVLLYCYHYDPNSKSYVLAATRVMRLGGLVTMLLLGFFLVAMWKREQQRLPAATQGAHT